MCAERWSENADKSVAKSASMTTAMGVTVLYNRVDKDQLMLLRSVQDNESNIIRAKGGFGAQPSGMLGVAQSALLPPYDPSRLKKHGKNGQPPPIAVARRNARERNRVKQVNDGFALLRQKIPNHVAAGYGDRGKKLSKVETLRMAVEYIRSLQRLLARGEGEFEGQELEQLASPAGSGFSGSTHNGSGEMLGIEDEARDGHEYLLEMNGAEEGKPRGLR